MEPTSTEHNEGTVSYSMEASNVVQTHVYVFSLYYRLDRVEIISVSQFLPQCYEYLQYKYNESNTDTHFNVSSLQYAGVFAENRCKSWPEGWYRKHICIII